MGKGSSSGEEDRRDSCFHSRSRSPIYKQREPFLSKVIEENEAQPTEEETVLGRERYPSRQAIDETLARWARNGNSNNIRGQQLSKPIEGRPVHNWEKIP